MQLALLSNKSEIRGDFKAWGLIFDEYCCILATSCIKHRHIVTEWLQSLCGQCLEGVTEIVVSWCRGFVVSWFRGVVVSWCRGGGVSWYRGVTVGDIGKPNCLIFSLCQEKKAACYQSY